MRRIVTGDDTWINRDPETKIAKHAVETHQQVLASPRKFKVQASADQIICTVFWYAEGILRIDYALQSDKVTVIGVYYADVLGKLLVDRS